MPGQPCLDLGMFVGAVVVNDEMNFQLFGSLAIDLLEETQPLDMRVTGLGARNDFAFKVIQRGKQSDRAMPDVIVSF